MFGHCVSLGGQAVSWNLPMAGSILAALPVLLIYIVLGRYFIRGLLAGSVFPLAVTIENAWNVAHAPFYITYDPQLVEYAGAAETISSRSWTFAVTSAA